MKTEKVLINLLKFFLKKMADEGSSRGDSRTQPPSWSKGKKAHPTIDG